MAAFEFPSVSTLWSQAKTLWAAERPNASVAPRSDVWVSTYIASKMWNRLHKTADRVLSAVFPSSTYGVYLDYWLVMVGASDGSGGLGRIIARGSSNGATDVTFTGVGTVSIGDQLTDADGLVYQFSANYTSGGAETTAVAVEAVSPGSATNLDASDNPVLTITAPGANVNAATTLSTDLDDGADDETDAAGRARLLTLLRRGPAGSWSDWVQIIEEASAGNLDAYVWPKRQLQPNGWGRTDYMALQRNESGTDKHIAGGSSLAIAIGTAVTNAMPVLLMVNSRFLTIVQASVPVEVTITLSDNVDSTKEADWDAESKKLTVAAQADPEIQASAQIDDILSNGDLVIIEGFEFEVENVGTAGNDKFDVVGTWPWGAGGPGIGKNIMSGGGIIADMLTALEEDLFDELGPAKGTYAAPIPGWEDSVYQVGVQSTLIQAAAGDIVDVAVALPAVTATPTAGSGATTQRLVPGELTIWEDK